MPVTLSCVSCCSDSIAAHSIHLIEMLLLIFLTRIFTGWRLLLINMSATDHIWKIQNAHDKTEGELQFQLIKIATEGGSVPSRVSKFGCEQE